MTDICLINKEESLSICVNVINDLALNLLNLLKLDVKIPWDMSGLCTYATGNTSFIN